MKHVQSYAAALLALALFGCAGSGRHSSNTDPLAGLSTPRVEAIVRVDRASLQHPNQFTDEQLLDPTNQAVYDDLLPGAKTVFGFQDPKNFQTNEDFVFQLAAYRADGSRVVLPATWFSSDVNANYGSVASNTGVFQAGLQATTSDLTMRGAYNGVEYQTQYAIRERQARVIGKVIFSDNLTPADREDQRILLYFYNDVGLVVGSVQIASDGSFRASVPQGAVSFTVVANSLPDSVYRVFSYEGNIYAASDPGCKAPLPALSLGTQTISSIGLIAVVPGQSAPDPTGCSG